MVRVSKDIYNKLMNNSLDYKINKYHNKKIIIDGHEFDSIKEGEHYKKLKLLERAGIISNLELQPKFLLIDTIRYNGKTYPKTYYIADFKYLQDGQEVVEDVKSEATRKDKVYCIKKKLFMYQYPNIKFKEVI